MMIQKYSEDHLASLLVTGVGCENHKSGLLGFTDPLRTNRKL